VAAGPRAASRTVGRIFPRIVTRNWRLKLAAFALAVVLWALVRSDPSQRSDVFSVSVRAEVGDDAWTLAADPDPGTVQVRFRGPTGDLIRLAREGTSLAIPLDSVAGADTLVELRRDWVAIDPGSGLVVEDIVPASVRLRLEPTLSTLVHIRVVIRGALPDGMALAAPVGLDPQVVRVRGPGRRVRAIDSISTEPLDLDGVTASGIYDVELDTAGLGGVTVAPLRASLAIRLEPELERELRAVPVVALPDSTAPLRDSLVIVPPTVVVRLAGARTPVLGTDAAAVRAVVPWEDLMGLGPGEQRRVPIRLRGLPALVRGVAAVDSVTVRVLPATVGALREGAGR
jgi:hypothetical protein